MFELDREVRNWREGLERTSSLSIRELDELEDHLRARVGLELELNRVLAPVEAFAMARETLGAPSAISREFAKSGRPRWRRFLLAGWVMYAASLFLPLVQTEWMGTARPELAMSATGYEFLWSMSMISGGFLAVLVLNLPMLLTVSALWHARLWQWRWLGRISGAVGILALGNGLSNLFSPPPILNGIGGDVLALEYPGAGYWLWSAAYVLVALALWFRSNQGIPDRPEKQPV
ncbi:hypothetical protein [Candidatus Palauibacter sp.]|uniref:hypothetical protein n=1 Tax=Candidatus Palauibacter sp. TaxID=3101350 RepID=UPI003B52548B